MIFAFSRIQSLCHLFKHLQSYSFCGKEQYFPSVFLNSRIPVIGNAGKVLYGLFLISCKQLAGRQMTKVFLLP